MRKSIKIGAILSSLLLGSFSLFGCSNKEDPVPTPEPEKPAEEAVIDLTGQTGLATSITYANKAANGVQAYYVNGKYGDDEYVVNTKNSSFSHYLKGSFKTIKNFSNASGVKYLENTMDVYALSGGDRVYAKKSSSDARVNTTNFGYYYYTVNVRDLSFEGIPCYLEKIYHTYPDKVNEQFRIVSSGPMADLDAFGFEVKVARENINSFEISDAAGVHTTAEGYDKDSVQYVALDVKDAGVIGFIMTDQAYKVSVEVTNKYVIIRQEVSVNTAEMGAGKDMSFGNRIYNDETHSFDGIRLANVLERNPLAASNIRVTEQDGAEYVGYNALKGCYEFALSGESFNTAYYVDQEKKFAESVKITGDEYDRTMYLYVHTGFPLEGAAVLDENNLQVPIPVQVSKNFGHEKEEPIYDPEDTIYGDSYLPVVVEKNSEKQFTVLNVYQNWGAYAIKQLSSISYYTSYYHLSTGVTETNCIAPYYAIKGPSLGYGSFNKSWFMPDFRGASGDMWTYGDPQYNSAGMLMSVNSGNGETLCNYLGSDIHSSGLTYADLEYSFMSEDGAFEYTMRHVEMPQIDEARTYYTISVKFLKDVTYQPGEFSLASFNGRNCTYKYASYLDVNGTEQKVTNINSDSSKATIYKLNKDSSYFTLYGINEKDTQDQSNFGMIIKDSKITTGGRESDLSLGYLNDWRDSLNYASLTLSERASFKVGDTIETDVIFLSYGKVGQEHYDNVKKVYNDSVIHPLQISGIVGTVVKDGYIPTITAKENQAEFALSGGTDGKARVNYTVKVTGVTKLAKPKLYEYVNGLWKEVSLSSAVGYDGYSVLSENGKLTYSFVFTQDSNGKIFKFSID